MFYGIWGTLAGRLGAVKALWKMFRYAEYAFDLINKSMFC